MSATLETLEKAVLSVLKEHFEEAQVELLDDLAPNLKRIAEQTAKYALNALKGDEEAKGNLADLRAQSGLLAAIVYDRGYRHGMEMFKEFMTAVARTLGVVVKAAIL